MGIDAVEKDMHVAHLGHHQFYTGGGVALIPSLSQNVECEHKV